MQNHALVFYTLSQPNNDHRWRNSLHGQNKRRTRIIKQAELFSSFPGFTEESRKRKKKKKKHGLEEETWGVFFSLLLQDEGKKTHKIEEEKKRVRNSPSLRYRNCKRNNKKRGKTGVARHGSTQQHRATETNKKHTFLETKKEKPVHLRSARNIQARLSPSRRLRIERERRGIWWNRSP